MMLERRESQGAEMAAERWFMTRPRKQGTPTSTHIRAYRASGRAFRGLLLWATRSLGVSCPFLSSLISA